MKRLTAEDFETSAQQPTSMLDVMDQRRSMYVDERNGFMDAVHSATVGVGAALDIFGRGSNIEPMQKAGEWLLNTRLAKPDTSQFYGNQGRIANIRDIILQSAPTTLGIAGAGLAGAAVGSLAAGPFGTIAGGIGGASGAMGIIGSGVYDQSYEEIDTERPWLDDRTKHEYAMVNALSEVGSEALSTLVPFLGGKILSQLGGKSAIKAVLNKIMDTGRITPKQVITSTVNKLGSQQTAKALFGAAVADGAGEVGNELVQAANRESVGLEKQEVDLIDLFIAGSAPGGAVMAGTLMMDNRAKERVKGQLNSGLQSGDYETRRETKGIILDAMSGIHEDVASLFDRTLDISQPVNLDAILEDQKLSPEDTLVDDITNNPEEAIAEAGIPTKESRYHSQLRTEPRVFPETIEDPETQRVQEGVATEMAQREAREAEVRERRGIGEVSRTSREMRESGVVTPRDAATTRLDTEMVEEGGVVGQQEASTQRLQAEMEQAGVITRRIIKKPEEISQKAWEDQMTEGILFAFRDGAVKNAILRGMDEVQAGTNQLKDPELTLEERKKVRKEIQKNEELIAEEIVANSPQVATDDVVVPEEVPEVTTEQQATTEEPVAPTEEGVVDEERLQEERETEEAQSTQPQEDQVSEETVVPEDVQWATERVQRTESNKRDIDQVATSLMDETPDVVDQQLAESVLVSLETKYREAGVKNPDSAAYNYWKRAAGRVEQVGPTIEKGTSTKERRWKVNWNGESYRAKTIKEAEEVLAKAKKGETEKLEPFEKDGQRKGLFQKELQGFDQAAKDEVNSFISRLDSPVVNQKGQTTGSTLRQLINKKVKKPKLQGFSKDDHDSILYEGIARTKGDGAELTPENVSERVQQLYDKEKNLTEQTRAAKQGVKAGGTVGETTRTDEQRLVEEGLTPYTQEKGIIEEGQVPEVKTTSVPEDIKVVLRKDGQYDVVDATSGAILSDTPFKDPVDAINYKKELDAEDMADFFSEPHKRLASHFLNDSANPQIAYNNFRMQYEGMEMRGALKDTDALLKKLHDEHISNQNIVETELGTGDKALDHILNLAGDNNRTLVSLAKAIDTKEIREKLAKVEVRYRSKKGPAYRASGNGVVFLDPSAFRDKGRLLHELVHAVTSRELGVGSSQLLTKVKQSMQEVKDKAIAKGLLNSMDLEMLKGMKTSKEFHDAINGGWMPANQSVAYAMLNEKEFIAQVFSSPDFQYLLKSMEGKNIFRRIIDFIGEAFGITDGTKLEEIVAYVPEIAKMRATLMRPVAASDMAPSLDYVKTVDAVGQLKSYEPTNIEKLREFGKDAKKWAEYIARPISDIIETKSKKIHARMISMESMLMQNQARYSEGTKPFMEWYSKLSKGDQEKYSFALMNSNMSDNQPIIAEIPKDIMEPLQEVLRDLYDRAEKVGLVFGEQSKAFYFPRRVNDVMGWVDHMQRDEVVKGQLGYAFKIEAQRLGRGGAQNLTPEEKAAVVTNMFQTGNFSQLPRPGATKERTVPFVTPDTFRFYDNAPDALHAHIFEMNEKIGQREFIGQTNRKQRIQQMLKRSNKIEQMEDGPERDEAVAQFHQEAMRLEDLDAEMEQAIGALVATEMSQKSASEQQEVISMLNARLRQQGSHGITDAIRNVGYITTMGNFLSAITQLGDIPVIFYRHGVNADTFKSAAEAFKVVAKIARRELTGKGKGEDLGAFVDQADFTNQLREFSQGKGTAKALEKVFKWSGLKFTDLIGKEAFMRAAYKKWQRPKNRDAFFEKYEPFFGDKTKDVYKDIQLGKRKGEDIMTVLLAELSDYQPITLSQQSQLYNKSGQGRIFFMLKTFTLRTTAAAFRDGAKEMQKGNYVRAAMTTSGILMIYALAGAGADELKDLLRGKTSTIKDSTIDNILQMFFLSRYTIDKGVKSEGLLKTITSNLLPPIRWADSLGADVYAMFSEDKELKGKTLQSVPLLGSIIYSNSKAGQSSFARQEKESILERVRENKEKRKGAYAGDLSKRIREHNKKVEAPEDRITNDTIMRAYRQ